MSLTIKVHIAAHFNLNLRTAKQTKLTDYNVKIRPKPIYHSNQLIAFQPKMSAAVKSASSAIKSSLIEPDGGVLVDLVVPESERGLRTTEAESMPRVKLTKIDLEWVHVISEGWASPLRGFMRENEYLQSLHFNCLRMKDGCIVNMSLPIVLAIDDETKERIGSSTNVALLGPTGDLIGILRRSVSFFVVSFLLLRVAYDPTDFGYFCCYILSEVRCDICYVLVKLFNLYAMVGICCE